ncbi:unnamed protein product [Aphis gossypii]|uniref:Glutamyl-tRNA(Gln) amidotransferase subunit C, mitochondrial n=1 Tax=Aphis gossypii TaxID=80765 RepID=A0A9P0JBT9_APHGO|nr:unnamed protein product [Aphis gossypii]
MSRILTTTIIINNLRHFTPRVAWLSSIVNKSIALDEDLVKRLETVSHVGFSKQGGFEVLSASVKFADRLTDIDTSKVLPLITVLENWDTGLRKDISSDKITRREIMCNSLVVEEDYFIAPSNQVL